MIKGKNDKDLTMIPLIVVFTTEFALTFVLHELAKQP